MCVVSAHRFKRGGGGSVVLKNYPHVWTTGLAFGAINKPSSYYTCTATAPLYLAAGDAAPSVWRSLERTTWCAGWVDFAE